MISKEQIQYIQDFAKNLMSPDDVHGWGHILRVVELCIQISQQESCNKDILLAAAYLHDIGRAFENLPEKKGINHAILSAEKAMPFMLKTDIIPADAALINNCIRSHCFSAGVKPESIEAKILSDSDKLDAMGTIGIYRMIVFQEPSNKGIAGLAQHLDEKLLRLKDQLHTKTAKNMAQPRHQLLVVFRDEIRREFKI